MEIGDEIAELAIKLDQWFEENTATFASHDHIKHRKAILRGVAIVRDLDDLKASGLAAIRSSLMHQNATPASERPALLIRTFAFAAKLKAVLHDELLDTDGANEIVLLMNEIADALDATSNGRIALAALLDDPDERVRASAGSYLLIMNLIPARVVPILREIDERNEGKSADFTAHWALLDWELKEKARKANNIDSGR